MAVPVDDIVDVSDSHVVNLLQFYWSNTYGTDKHSDTHEDILNFVELLWTLDYSGLEISNENGKLCPNYPSRIFIPDAHMKSALSKVKTTVFFAEKNDDDLKLCVPKADQTKIFRKLYKVLDVEYPGNEDNSQEYTRLAIKTNYQSIECVSPLLSAQLANYKEYCSSIEERTKTLQKLMENAIYGRSRHRIVVPVILYNGVYVTRSATIPMAGEYIYRKAEKFVYSLVSFDLKPLYDALTSSNEEERDDARRNLSAIDQARAADVALLKHMKINTVFDLMVEEMKVCYGLNTASSEKALRNEEINHYSHFFINQVPYPGCEYFAKFAKTLHSEDLVFDWNDPKVNADFRVENEHLLRFNNPHYKTWALDYLTKHYLMIMLTHLKRGETQDGGLLVHCISGWDRTPLFISLLRMSLWADGEIHQSLCPLQMLYFTLAYDWMFFCHDMKLRTSKMELILFFCFYFLKFIKGENFNIKSGNFGQKIEEHEYSDEFEMLDLPEAKSPDQSLSEAYDFDEMLNMSKSPDNLKKENIARTKTRESDDFEVLNAGCNEPTQDKVEAKKTLTEMLLGRGMSSPTEPGANMPKDLLTDSERTRAFRYQQITALRRIFFKVFKKSLPNAEGLGTMEMNYEK